MQWGDDRSPPVLVSHGGGDFIRSFDVFAPYLVEGGYRVIGWDHRGHGDSGRADLYGWSGDLHDAEAVVRSVVDSVGEPVPLVGHSKSGVLTVELAAERPELLSRVVAIDGFCRRRLPPVPVPETAAAWFHRRRDVPPWRPAPLDHLAMRRHKINARLPTEWMQYLVTVGADKVAVAGDSATEDQWVWKLDPMAFGIQPHSWRESMSLELLSTVTVPLLALVAGDAEAFAGQPDLDDLRAHLPTNARLEVLEGLGHFAHIEDPATVARHVLDWLGRPNVAGH